MQGPCRQEQEVAHHAEDGEPTSSFHDVPPKEDGHSKHRQDENVIHCLAPCRSAVEGDDVDEHVHYPANCALGAAHLESHGFVNEPDRSNSCDYRSDLGEERERRGDGQKHIADHADHGPWRVKQLHICRVDLTVALRVEKP